MANSLILSDTFSATGTKTWTPSKAGYYHLLIGPTGGNTFGTDGSVAVSQRGIPFEGLTAVTTPTRKVVHLLGGSEVSFVLTASGGTPDLDIEATPV